VVSVLACLVVFCTTYTLILPAITLEREPKCGKVEHTHTEECYTQVTSYTWKEPVCCADDLDIHEHGEECYDENGELVCGYADFVAHVHTEDCYDENGDLWCDLPEIEPHVHDASCYDEADLENVHLHGDECYTVELGDLVCKKGEDSGTGTMVASPSSAMEAESQETVHEHTDECYEQKKVLACAYDDEESDSEDAADKPEPICDKDEIILHEHDEDCYDEDGNLICGQIQILEHVHTDECFEIVEEAVDTEALTCTIPEGEGSHHHDERCYNNKGKFVCELEETPGHQHGPHCYGTWVATCGLEEHVHTDECRTMTASESDAVIISTSSNVVMSRPMFSKPLNNAMVANGESAKLPVTGASGSGTTYDAATGNYNTELKIDFKFENGAVAGQEYVFDYTKEIIVPDDLIGIPHTLLDENKTEAGTFTFVKNSDGTYSVKVVFKDTYLSGAGNVIEGHISFNGSMKVTAGEDGTIKVQIGEDGTEIEIPSHEIEYPGGKSDRYDISTSKGGVYKTDGNKIVYTVYVRSLEGTPDKIFLNDKIVTTTPQNIISTPPSNITVEKGTCNYYSQWEIVDNNDWTTVTNVPTESGNGQISMTLDGLDKGQEGWKDKDNRFCTKCNCYRIQYTYDLGDQEFTEFTVDNKVQVEATGSKDGQTVRDEDTSQVGLNLNKNYGVYKSGELKNGKIHWKIILNSSHVDITGSKLSDDMLGNISKGTNITVSPNKGYKIEDGYIEFVESDNKPNTEYYTIEYDTDAPPSKWDTQKVHNIAVFDPTPDKPGDESNASADVEVPGIGKVEKKCQGMTPSPNGETGEISWKVVIDVPAEGLPKGAVIEDTIEWDEHWMDRNQITEWNVNLNWSGNGGTVNLYNGPKMIIEFKGSDGKPYPFNKININDPNSLGDLKYKGFKITFPDGLVPPNGQPHQLIFEYKTTADLRGINSDETTFRNNIKVAEKYSSDDYVYRKDSVVKTDGNGQTGTTSTSSADGKLTWKVKVSVSEGKNYKRLNVTDILPTGVVPDKISLSNGTNMELKIDADGTISGSNDTYNVSGSYDSATGKIELTMTNKDSSKSIKSNTKYEFTFECHADSQKLGAFVAGTKYTFTNEVYVTTDDMDLGSAEQTQEWTYTEVVDDKDIMTKTGNWDNNARLLKYSIVINPKGKDLVEGEDTLELTDTFSYNSKFSYNFDNHQYDGATMNASLVQSSVKLYEAKVDSEGNLKKDESKEVKDWKWTYDVHEKDGDQKPIDNIIKATGIPDSTPLILEYSYSVTTSIPKDHSVSLPVYNSAKLEGINKNFSDNTGGKIWQNQGTSGGVTSDKSYTFYKVEKGNYNKNLEGAVFTVYEYNPSTGADDLEAQENWTETNIGPYRTDRNGIFRIRWKEGDTECGYKPNTLYKVVETAAPDGYEMPDEQVPYYFYFSSETDTEHVLPQNLPASAVDLSQKDKTEYVENVRNKTDIVVKKIWKDKDGKVVEHGSPIELTLYQKACSASSGSSGAGEAGVSYEVLSYWNPGGTPLKKKTTITNAVVGSTIEYTIQAPGCNENNHQPIECGHGLEPIMVNANGKDDTERYGKWNYGTITSYTGQAIVTANEVKFLVADNNSYDIETFEVRCIGSSIPGPDSDGVINKIKDFTLSPGNSWREEFGNLPLTDKVKAEDGSDSIVYYYYYVEEKSVTGYETSYENNTGITNGIITVTNTAKDTPGHELPETGGPGTRPYTLGGLLTLFAGCLLLYRNKKRGKEDFASS